MGSLTNVTTMTFTMSYATPTPGCGAIIISTPFTVRPVGRYIFPRRSFSVISCNTIGNKRAIGARTVTGTVTTYGGTKKNHIIIPRKR